MRLIKVIILTTPLIIKLVQISQFIGQSLKTKVILTSFVFVFLLLFFL